MVAGTPLTGFLLFFIAAPAMFFLFVYLIDRYWPVDEQEVG